MTRLEHNRHLGANRQPDEYVCCSLCGYGELDQYDARCAQCWLGHSHTWAQHDNNLKTVSAQKGGAE